MKQFESRFILDGAAIHINFTSLARHAIWRRPSSSFLFWRGRKSLFVHVKGEGESTCGGRKPPLRGGRASDLNRGQDCVAPALAWGPAGSARTQVRRAGAASIARSHGVMVSTLDFESSDPSSNLGGTFFARSRFCSDFCPRGETKCGRGETPDAHFFLKSCGSGSHAMQRMHKFIVVPHTEWCTPTHGHGSADSVGGNKTKVLGGVYFFLPRRVMMHAKQLGPKILVCQGRLKNFGIWTSWVTRAGATPHMGAT